MHTIPLDYETLRLIWWLLLGVLLIGFAITDGYDLGVGALLPFGDHKGAGLALILAGAALWVLRRRRTVTE